MFKPTAATTPDQYISMIEDDARRQDIIELHTLITRHAPGFAPHILAGMIGYGTYRYTYASGKEGDWSLLALASQKNYISLYVACIKNGTYLAETYRDRLPKANIGKSCIRFKRLSDVNKDVLGDIISEAVTLGGAGQAPTE